MKADKGMSYAKGGRAGMHRMPDGTMMKDSEHKMGGKTKKYAKGGVTRGDGMCTKGHTRGKMV